ncbi:MAG: ATP-binding protein [Pseudomonadota bacterium]
MTGNAPASQRRQLSLKLLGYILLVSSLITLLLTAWQLWSDYQRDVSGIEERLGILEQTTLEPLTNSVWALNEDQINLLLTGMMNLDAVVGVELVTDQGRVYRLGSQTAGDGLVRNYPLTYRNPRQDGQPYPLGNLTVHASLEGVYERLMARTANILVGQAIKTFIVSIFILAIVQQLVTRHLGSIADYARGLSLSNLQRPLRLNRARRPGQQGDEFDQVETAINYMRETLIEDMAQREAAERRLQQSEARYRQLFEASIDGLGIFDLEGRLLTANRAYLEMIGYPELEEARHLTFRQLTPGQWYAMEQAIIADQVMVRGYSDIYEKEYIHRDGHAFPVSVRSWLVRDEHGEPQFLTSFVRDISREKQLALEHAQLEQQLRESQRMETVGTLAGGIAHDFNNILTPVRGYAEMLARENAGNPAVKTRAEAIFHAAERGRKLVEQILLFSRKGNKTHRVPTDLAQVTHETLELAALTRPKNVRVQVDVATADCRLTGDPTQLHQLVLNLVINAFHALEEKGGELRLDIADAPSPLDGTTAGLQLTIADTGCGIKPEHIAKIFEPFFTTRETGRGTGLGLSVVHGIVKGHGGDIAVQSSPAGTTFRIWLPRQAAGAA